MKELFFRWRDITKDPNVPKGAKGIGYLAQEASVFRKLTVEDNIMAIWK